MALNIPILSSLDTKGFDKAAREFKNLSTASEKSGYAIKKAAVPAAAAVVGLAAAAVGAAKAAMDDQAAQLLLAGTLQRTTGATDETIAATESYISQLSMASAVADDDLRPALSKLLLGTKNLGKAQELLSVGLDLSAATGKDLATVTDALAKGYAGNTKGLRTLSPEVASLIKGGGDFSDVLAVLKTNFGGASAEAANTAQGGFKKLKIAISETYENIGNALIPAIDAVLPLLVNLGTFAQKNAAFIVVMGVAIGGFATALVLASVAMRAWKAISVITTAINYALATSYTAVQVATGIGIVTALAGAAAFVVIKSKMDAARGAATAYGDSLLPVIKNQEDLNNFVGPVASRDFDDFKRAAREAAKSASVLEAQQEKAKAAAEKLAATLKVLKTELREKFKKALEDANAVLETATNKFNDFARSVSDAVSSSYSFGSAQETAANNVKAVAEASADVATAQKAVAKAIADSDPEGLTEAYLELAAANKKLEEAQATPKSFLDNLKVQAKKVKEFGVLVNRLLAAGLSESALQQVLEAGVDGGTAIAQELLGSAGAILEANTLTKDVQAIADQVGANSAKKFYEAGVTAGANLVAGIEAVIATYTPKLNAVNTAGGVASLTSGFTAAVGGVMGSGGTSSAPMSLDFQAISDWLVQNPLDLSAIDFSGIATLASGGIVNQPTLALIGEGNGPEAVIPLSQMAITAAVTQT